MDCNTVEQHLNDASLLSLAAFDGIKQADSNIALINIQRAIDALYAAAKEIKS